MDKNMETEETKERKEVLTIVIPSLRVLEQLGVTGLLYCRVHVEQNMPLIALPLGFQLRLSTGKDLPCLYGKTKKTWENLIAQLFMDGAYLGSQKLHSKCLLCLGGQKLWTIPTNKEKKGVR